MQQREVMERQKQVVEAEKKVQMLNQRMAQTEAKAKSFNMQGMRAQFTEQELANLDDESKVYKAVGRMFVLRTRSAMVKEQQETQEKCKEEVQKAITTSETLTKSLEEGTAEFDRLYKQFIEEMKLFQEAQQKK